MDAATKGAAALSASDFPLAIKLYTLALAAHPKAVDYYIKRSTAYIRSSPSNPILALGDAETAIVLAHERGKRELIGQSQLRRAVALYGAERYGDAQQCIEWVKELTPKESSLGIWEAKIKNKLSTLAYGDDKAEVKVKKMPNINVETLSELASKAASASDVVELKKEGEEKEQPVPKQDSTPNPEKFRKDWYQNSETVTVNLLMKNVPKTESTIEIQPDSISLSFPLPSGSTFDFCLDPLFAKIDPERSTSKIMSTKVEWVLRKANPGQKWRSLEGSEATSVGGTDAAVPTSDGNEPLGLPSPPNPPKAGGPAYPTSSKSGPKDWDKLAKDLNAKPKVKKTTKEVDCSTGETVPVEMEVDDPDAPDDEDDAGGDPVNGFFKKLFKGADPDTQRAMMKSYQESNGTALSTNWSEVGKAKVETSPPDGMIAKKWGE